LLDSCYDPRQQHCLRAVSWILGRYAKDHYFLKDLNFSAFASDDEGDDADAAADGAQQQAPSDPCAPQDFSDDTPLFLESEDEAVNALCSPSKALNTLK
jgi:hypothetical protein